jgi:hypothetical protein
LRWFENVADKVRMNVHLLMWPHKQDKQKCTSQRDKRTII